MPKTTRTAQIKAALSPDHFRRFYNGAFMVQFEAATHPGMTTESLAEMVRIALPDAKYIKASHTQFSIMGKDFDLFSATFFFTK